MLKGDFPVSRFAGLRTPFYYYDLPLLRRTLDAVQVQLERNPDFRVHYAVKANFNPRILAEIAQRGFGADCVSGGEIRAALQAGFAPRKAITLREVPEIRKSLAARLGPIKSLWCVADAFQAAVRLLNGRAG